MSLSIQCREKEIEDLFYRVSNSTAAALLLFSPARTLMPSFFPKRRCSSAKCAMWTLSGHPGPQDTPSSSLVRAAIGPARQLCVVSYCGLRAREEN